MFQREILQELLVWKQKNGRKPLIIRGPRQVGKTSLIHLFSKSFKHYLYFNLERPEDRIPFQEIASTKALLEALFFSKSLPFKELENSLLFIDEVQEMPKIINQLRYFYEDFPGLAVICAGSLLETLFTRNLPFPVGRVEYKIVRPVSFAEFLMAMGENQAIEVFSQVPIPTYALPKLFELFHRYALLGGLPEIIKTYVESKDLVLLQPIYESIFLTYQDDIEKYASGSAQIQQIRHVVKQMFFEGGKRIKFEGFGNSNYRSREMGEAFRILERAFIIRLVYPCTEAKIPIQSDFRKSPRLQIFDSGLFGYFAGYQKDLLGTKDLNEQFQGTFIEHWIGQELLANNSSPLAELHFWVRDKKGSSAEVDYIIQHQGAIIPIEVKSGRTGKLKSLFSIMDQFNLTLAIRFYAGPVLFSKLQTPAGKDFYLISMPYFLVSKLDAYILWAKSKIEL